MSTYDLDGVFVGSGDGMEVNAGLRLQSEAVSVTTFTEHGESVKAIPATTAGARKHIDKVARELRRAAERQRRREERQREQEARRLANLERERVPVPKPKAPKRSAPRSRTCSACQGVSGYVEFCVACQRTGKVRG